MKFAYPRKPATQIVIVSDIDGTIMQLREGVKKIPYGDAEGLLRDQVANARVVARLKGLEESGFRVAFCSGRSTAEEEVTVQQLEAAGFQDVQKRLHLQAKYLGIAALIQHKTNVQERLQAALHIGDQSFDIESSVRSGTSFMHVHDFAAGETLDGAFCWICGCTPLRACRGGCEWATPRTCSRCARPGEASLVDFVDVGVTGGAHA